MVDRSHEVGAVSGLMIGMVVAAVLAVGFAVTTVLAYVNYTDQKENVDSKVATAVADAKKKQLDEDQSAFSQREKEPNRQFSGPDDYGHLTFMYPKTWSVYVARDVSNGGNYEAYLNPGVVPPVTQNQLYALRVTILSQDYDQVVKSYANLVQTNKLKSSAVTVGDHTGTRLEGQFNQNLNATMVIFKIRDKTLTMRVDAESFKPDFEALVKTINFNT